MYPVLSSFESNESSESDNENNCCTTASVSADETKAATQPLRANNDVPHNQYDQRSDDEIEDRCEDSIYSCLLFLLCIE